ncbi:hypothetical protein KUV28_02670 [Ferrimonas balearica]|nr:hypothetical protein [Ferrimonas balearica]
MQKVVETSAPDRPVLIGIAGQDRGLEPVIRILENRSARRRAPLRLRRFPLPDLTGPDAARRLMGAGRSGGFDAVHFADPLRSEITDLLADRRSPLAPGQIVDTLLFSDEGPALGCDAGTRALEECLAPFLAGRPAHHVLIVGAGTEGQSVAMALAALGVPRLTFYDRDMGRAAALANLVNRATRSRAALLASPEGLFHEFSRPGLTRGWIDGIVNATPVGGPHRPGQVLPDEGFQAPLWLVDIAAIDGATPLTRRAADRGCALLTGAEIARRRAERLLACSQGGGHVSCSPQSCQIDLAPCATPISQAG